MMMMIDTHKDPQSNNVVKGAPALLISGSAGNYLKPSKLDISFKNNIFDGLGSALPGRVIRCMGARSRSQRPKTSTIPSALLPPPSAASKVVCLNALKQL